ncbi:MAG: M14 family zinc carboxypeptidase [Candidatus Palauibacterales bacterium]|nr:M14 family zinc carboxypeptidase [Candidatus Palauibacterales bacterium]
MHRLPAPARLAHVSLLSPLSSLCSGVARLAGPLAAALVAAALLLAAAPSEARAQAQPPIAVDYPVEGVTGYLEDVPSPDEVLGVLVGERHARPAELVEYFQRVAAASDRVVLRRHGRTYQGRPLVHAVVTSPENHARLEEIRRANLRLSDEPGAVTDDEIAGMPSVVYMGYSVHGDEASGSDASLLTLHHLAAGQGAEVERVLENSVVIVDPSINPDGRARFVEWVTDNRGRVPTTDPQDREHNQPWPGGRTNQYFFDLNRDWLPVQHPSSKGRLELFHHWRPQLHLDFHEMGGDDTYFFQPGVPSRRNPNTPVHTNDLTREVARFHARALDEVDELYFSEENYDDFYYGKGSTYPDVNGGVGILFEQASARSLRAETDHGILPYEETVRNQFATSLSSLRAGVELREELLANQRRHYREAPDFVAENPVKGWLVSGADDLTRAQQFLKMMQRHRIRVHELASTVEREGETFRPGEAWVIPLDQPQARLVNGLLEKRTTFRDSLFYDVSAWTMTLSFGLPHAELTSDPSGLLGEEIGPVEIGGGEVVGGRADYAYVLAWDRYYAPRALYRLQEAGVRPLVAEQSFTMPTADGGTRTFPRGSIVVPVEYRAEGSGQTADDVHRIVRQAASEDHVVFHALDTGRPEGGIWPGGPNTEVLEKPRVAVLSGEGTSGYRVGEAWHLLNERMGVPVSLLNLRWVTEADLDRYNTIVLAGGAWGADSATAETLASWVREGGLLVTVGNGVRMALDQGLLETSLRETELDLGQVAYGDLGARRGAQYIGGTIFEVNLDPTHPVAYGYGESVPVFRAHNTYVEPSEEPGVTVGTYAAEPLLSGYLHPDQEPQLAGSASILAAEAGGGQVISFLDNPNFRAFWHGTNGLFLNAVFFGGTL